MRDMICLAIKIPSHFWILTSLKSPNKLITVQIFKCAVTTKYLLLRVLVEKM